MACVDYLSRPFKNTGNCLMECSLPEAVSVSQFSAYVFESISFMSWALTHTGKWVLKLGVKCSRKETWDLLRQSCGVLGWEKLKSLENSLGYLWDPDQRCFRGWRLWSPYRCPLEFCTEQFLHCNGSACEWFPEVPRLLPGSCKTENKSKIPWFILSVHPSFYSEGIFSSFITRSWRATSCNLIFFYILFVARSSSVS